MYLCVFLCVRRFSRKHIRNISSEVQVHGSEYAHFTCKRTCALPKDVTHRGFHIAGVATYASGRAGPHDDLTRTLGRRRTLAVTAREGRHLSKVWKSIFRIFHSLFLFVSVNELFLRHITLVKKKVENVIVIILYCLMMTYIKIDCY